MEKPIAIKDTNYEDKGKVQSIVEAMKKKRNQKLMTNLQLQLPKKPKAHRAMTVQYWSVEDGNVSLKLI